MDAADYHAAQQVQVSDPRVYIDVTDSIAREIQVAVAQLHRLVQQSTNALPGLMTMQLQAFLLAGATMTTPPPLYVMPKLHKMGNLSDRPIKSRPIAACHSWVTTNVSKWLADILNATLVKYPQVLLNRDQLVRQLDGVRIHKDAWLVAFDVESLYPSVEHDGCVRACSAAVCGSPRYKQCIGEFVRFVLTHNIVTVQGRYYRQIFGGAMGTNCMPPAAQLYLAVLWEGRLQQELGTSFPSAYWRFIDDGFCIFEGSEQQLQAFLARLNSLLPNIRITHTYSQFQVDFLDLVIEKRMEDVWCCAANTSGTVGIRVRTHQKPLNRYLYIPYTSHHPPGMFASFIRAELLRYVSTNSDECWFKCMVRKLVHRLRQRGYPLPLLQQIVDSIKFTACRQAYLQKGSTTADCTTGDTLVLPLRYARLTHELHPQQILYNTYSAGGDELHATLPVRPIVAFMKSKNLGAHLVKAAH